LLQAFALLVHQLLQHGVLTLFRRPPADVHPVGREASGWDGSRLGCVTMSRPGALGAREGGAT
jgi:hypothetical protein